MVLDMIWTGHHPPGKWRAGDWPCPFAERYRIQEILSILCRLTELSGHRGDLFGDGSFTPSLHAVAFDEAAAGAIVEGDVLINKGIAES
ncbi:hypothetical protein J3459_006082 [Metarhizium acridum]|nr:hypothetical protein J3459_006082 [Metarhizium acridum]